VSRDEVVERLRATGCVFAEDEAALLRETAGTTAELAAMLDRRVAGEPLEHVLGWVELRGERYIVGPGVFVPRQRSRVLVDAALELLEGTRAPVVLEICCGVAALGAAIGRARPDAEVWASDLDPAAVAIARRNLPPERVRQGDLFAGLPGELAQRVDLVVANAPYVPTDEIVMMPVEAREHEPRLSLDGGADGVDLHRRIAAESVIWLAPGGALVIETSRRQVGLTRRALAENGFGTSIRRDDEIDGTAVVGMSRWADMPASR
jgi:release factor glutamine methyltransferase